MIGLAPINTVAQDLAADGFSDADTVHAARASSNIGMTTGRGFLDYEGVDLAAYRSEPDSKSCCRGVVAGDPTDEQEGDSQREPCL